MLKLLVLLMIHDYIQRYLMLKIVTHYSQISIVYKFKYLSFSTNVSITSDYVNAYVSPNLKDLGIIMSSNCSFGQHIIELCKRCTGLCGWILRSFSSRESTVMMTLFKSLVLSRLDYGSQLWLPLYSKF